MNDEGAIFCEICFQEINPMLDKDYSVPDFWTAPKDQDGILCKTCRENNIEALK